MSVVCQAKQLALNRIVAIKMLHQRMIAEATAMQRLMQEGRRLAVAQSAHVLEDPNVLKLVADELERGPIVLQASNNYADALSIAQTRLKVMKAINEVKKDPQSATEELHASATLTLIQKKCHPVNIKLSAGNSSTMDAA